MEGPRRIVIEDVRSRVDRRTRINGDYHLGQVIIADNEPTIIDFEQLWPAKPGDAALLLEAFLPDKASRELEYELATRPAWADVPIRGLRADLEGPQRA